MKRRILIVLFFVVIIAACTSNSKQEDLTSWDEDRIYDYLEEVQLHIREIPAETDSLDQIIEQYELYFTPELSKEIVDSLYVQVEEGWRIPDGDAGYIFSVPDRDSGNSEVMIAYTKDSITIKESFEFGMFREIEYTIRLLDKKAKITEWKRVFD